MIKVVPGSVEMREKSRKMYAFFKKKQPSTHPPGCGVCARHDE